MGAGVISDRTLELIAALRAAGVVFAIVSGLGGVLLDILFSEQNYRYSRFS